MIWSGMSRLTRDRVDWVAKKFLLNALREEEKLAWTDPWLQAIDLEYHNILPDQGLFYELLGQGSMRRIVSEEEIKSAIFAPPETTRAFFRGRSVARFNDAITSIQWDEIVFANGASFAAGRAAGAANDARLETLKRLSGDEFAISSTISFSSRSADLVIASTTSADSDGSERFRHSVGVRSAVAEPLS